jgi:RNA polymerase sigma factor (sigma-70 family)
MAPSATATTNPNTAATGDPARFDEYCETSVRIAARGLVGRYGIRDQDVEDVQHDIIVNLLPRLQAYNPAKGAWSTHVKNAVEKATASVIRHRCAQRRIPPKKVQDPVEAVDPAFPKQQNEQDSEYGKLVALPDGMLDHRTDKAEHAADQQMDLETAIQHLTPLQQRICAALKRMSVGEAATELGLERWQVYQAIEQIRVVFARFELDPTAA